MVMIKSTLVIVALGLALACGNAQAASGKHFMRKAGGTQQSGSGGGAGKVRLQSHKPQGPHMLNPQPLPPG